MFFHELDTYLVSVTSYLVSWLHNLFFSYCSGAHFKKFCVTCRNKKKPLNFSFHPNIFEIITAFLLFQLSLVVVVVVVMLK